MEPVGTAEFGARLEALRRRIAEACRRADRDPTGVRLVAVSKTCPPEAVDCARNAGLGVFGESRVQEAAAKIPLCGSAEWHLVGHLQRNKVRAALELFDVIHAVDSPRLLEALGAAVAAGARSPRLLLEVNVSGERSKFGFAPADVPEALRAATQTHGLRVEGLMTIAPFDPDPAASRPWFRRLRELRDRLQSERGSALPELSMGMSGDFETAIEEGATWIRVGSALFGRRSARPPHAADTGRDDPC